MLGRIIAIEGIDQSGKRTQARLLVNRLKREGVRASSVSFPIYTSPSGRQLGLYLRGRQTYPPQALHMLYSLNRWENLETIKRLVDKNDFVITDRYTPSNLVYGVSRRLSLSWLQGLDEGLPPANLVMVLDVPIQSSFTRKSRNRDIHERDRRLLAKVRHTYKILAAKFDWKVIDATGPAEEVHSAIWAVFLRKFKVPYRARSKPT